MKVETPIRECAPADAQSACITAGPAAALAATLECDCAALQPGDAVPPLWHWLYFLPGQRASELGEDGQSRSALLRPQATLPRPVWSGTRLRFMQPLRVGDTAWRATRVLQVARPVDGASNQIVTVLRHEVRTGAGLVLTEDEDWVSRRGSTAARPVQMLAPVDHVWQQEVYPNEVLLFRYSALTFNSHRVHYDRRFAELEGHGGLVVQTQLMATLLLELVRRNLPAARIGSFSFRAVQPLFDTGPFAVCGRPENDGNTVRLWAKNAIGGLAVSGAATLSYT